MGNVLGTATGCAVEVGHNLELVLSVLPVVGDLSKRLSDETKKRDKRYGYLVNIQTSARTLMAHLENIAEDGETESFEHQINQLADCLEEIFSDQVIRLSKLKASKHPRLHAVREIASTSDDWEPNKRDLFDSSNLESLAAWNKLQRNLESLTDELQSYGDNVDETEEPNMPTTSQEPEEEVCNFVNRVFNAVLCRCHTKSERDLRLRIGTYKKGKSKPISESLCVLLAQDKSLLWHELLIHDQPKPKRNVKFVKVECPTSRTRHRYPDSSGSTSCICSYLKAHPEPDSLRLDVILDHDVLHPSGLLPNERTFKPESLQEHIDLKSLLSFESKPWNLQSKWLLAVTLAYGLFYLYDGPRVKWRRENILFFKDGTHIPLRPFVSTSVSQSCEEATDDGPRFHRYPEIVELGVILLEIHLGQSLESFSKDGRDITTDTKIWGRACLVYRKEAHRIESVQYRKAIEACLTPGTFAEIDSDVQKLRSVLFQSVVRPLEEELARNFQDVLNPDNLDEEAEKCDLALSVPFSNRRSTSSSRCVRRRQDDLHVTSHYNAVLSLQPAGHAKADQTLVTSELTSLQPLLGSEPHGGAARSLADVHYNNTSAGTQSNNTGTGIQLIANTIHYSVNELCRDKE
ncbi:hypothetical protein EDB80DRAFT_4793 [Ilyonectria destructans]|nr:hypothetical protein EDB80DRAFT_4793 [Ilyonectria destructans]